MGGSPASDRLDSEMGKSHAAEADRHSSFFSSYLPKNACTGHLVPVVTIVCLFAFVCISVGREDFAAAYKKGSQLRSGRALTSRPSEPQGTHSLKAAAISRAVEPRSTAERPEASNDLPAFHQPHPGAKSTLGRQGKQGHSSKDRWQDGSASTGEAEAGSGRKTVAKKGGKVEEAEGVCEGVVKWKWPSVKGLQGMEEASMHASSDVPSQCAGPASQKKKLIGRCALVGKHAHLAKELVGAAIDSHDIVVRLGRSQPAEHRRVGLKTTMRLLQGSLLASIEDTGLELDTATLLLTKNGSAYIEEPCKMAVFESLGATLKTLKGVSSRQVMELGTASSFGAMAAVNAYTRRLQCAFEGKVLSALDVEEPATHPWSVLHALLRVCDGGVAVYGFSRETFSPDESLAREDYNRGMRGGRSKEFVESVLVRELSKAGHLVVCDKDAKSDCSA